jgi:hypothetical protein
MRRLRMQATVLMQDSEVVAGTGIHGTFPNRVKYTGTVSGGYQTCKTLMGNWFNN